jgi:hypothetical protein
MHIIVESTHCQSGLTVFENFWLNGCSWQLLGRHSQRHVFTYVKLLLFPSISLCSFLPRDMWACFQATSREMKNTGTESHWQTYYWTVGTSVSSRYPTVKVTAMRVRPVGAADASPLAVAAAGRIIKVKANRAKSEYIPQVTGMNQSIAERTQWSHWR